ncbi:LAMI_0D02322g1_1 [Lachancea mirantina]|uniref:LAMI_0D02322g1_1 n=1 Tax=Lachancea mirantina TaxID=1230905 RepID=A0A1G4J9M0_9SACH|nr:LAMI_0D02322g1_1 [Lachancea mirantina]
MYRSVSRVPFRIVRRSPDMYTFVPNRFFARHYSTEMTYVPPDISLMDKDKWRKMDRNLREEVIQYLDWKMEDSWTRMANGEKRAAYFISYGEWGPRAQKGSRDAQIEMTTPELALRGVFSGILFTALAISVVNYKKEKNLPKNGTVETIDSLKA